MRRKTPTNASGAGGRVTARRRRAFTIVEMLVAISVIAILTGLLIPAVGAVRARARSSESLSNLRQLAIGALTYANISNEWLPPAILHFDDDSGVIARSWDFEQRGNEWRPGAIWHFIGDGRVLQCPDVEVPLLTASGITPAAGQVEPFTGYNYNTTYLGSEGFLPGLDASGVMLDGWRNARLGARPAQVRRPEVTAFFGEGGWKGGPNRYMRAPMNSVEFSFGTVYAGGQAFRGRGVTHVVRLDGHADVVARPWPGAHAESQPSLVDSVMDFPNNGFLSNDDDAYAP